MSIKKAQSLFQSNCQLWRSINQFQLTQWPNRHLPEIIFIGASNAGKSSLINRLTNTKICKTSKKPGHTKKLNLITLNEQLILIDSPGYGYKSHMEWGELVNFCFEESSQLKMIYLLINSKRGLNHIDEMMLNQLNTYQVPVQLILTKGDKHPEYKRVPEVSIRNLFDGTNWKLIQSTCLPNAIVTSKDNQHTGILKLQESILQHCK